jgi:hypothetical protein
MLGILFSTGLLCVWALGVCWFWVEYFLPMRLIDWIERDRFVQFVMAAGIPSIVVVLHVAALWFTSLLAMLALPVVVVKLWEKRRAKDHTGDPVYKLEQS